MRENNEMIIMLKNSIVEFFISLLFFPLLLLSVNNEQKDYFSRKN